MLLRGWRKQTALAQALGVKPSAVSRWVKNGSLSFEHAVAVCDFLDISLDWLMLGRGKPDSEPWPSAEKQEERSATAIETRAREALKIFTAALPELFAPEAAQENEFRPTAVGQTAEPGAAAGMIEVALCNGRVLRLPEFFAPARVARLVEALEETSR
jgi:transcriptional regulator with XRE-family HTH domain